MSDAIPPQTRPAARVTLAASLRNIRTARGLRVAEMARRMALHPRSYERFEAGERAFDFEDLECFAQATDSDPFAIWAGVLLGDPEFALRAADNKLMIVFMMALRDFNAELRDDIAMIESRLFVGAFRKVFQDIADHMRNRDLTAEHWLESASAQMGLNVSFQPSLRRKP